MFWFLNTLLCAGVVRGTVAVYLPLVIAGDRPAVGGSWLWIAPVLFALGAAIYIRCVGAFATFGRGTPAPIEKGRRGNWRGGQQAPLSYPKMARALLDELLEVTLAVAVEEDAIRLHDAAPLDAVAVERRMEQLAGLAAALLPSHGPYR